MIDGTRLEILLIGVICEGFAGVERRIATWFS